MDHLEYLFAGFAVFWGGLLTYVVWLQARLRSVQRELERLEERLEESEQAHTVDRQVAYSPPAAGAVEPSDPRVRPAPGA